MALGFTLKHRNHLWVPAVMLYAVLWLSLRSDYKRHYDGYRQQVAVRRVIENAMLSEDLVRREFPHSRFLGWLVSHDADFQEVLTAIKRKKGPGMGDALLVDYAVRWEGGVGRRSQGCLEPCRGPGSWKLLLPRRGCDAAGPAA